MKKIRALSLYLSLSLALVAAFNVHATVRPNDAGKALVQAGDVLLLNNQFKQAFDKYQEAAKADPQASEPLSKIANALRVFAASSSAGDDANRAEALRQARLAAQSALKLDASDPMAQEVLRLLNDEKPAPLHVPSAEVAAMMQQGEAMFAAQKLDEARALYERAAQMDPQYSAAWIYAGDCFYVQQKWAEAEARFRKGVEAEPLNAQGWRFLADALMHLNQRAAAEDALFNGIAAQPSQLPNWGKLAQLRAANHTPLTPLHLTAKYSVSVGADGKSTVKLDSSFSDADAAERKKTDGAVWMALALSESGQRTRNRNEKVADQPFAIDLAGWRTAMQMADELAAKGTGDLSDPALKTMRMLAKADQLEPALLLLQYKESYRPALEAWKREHPDGIRKFVDTYGLQP
jgi:tetratricopeptide (TPR) repeat protein